MRKEPFENKEYLNVLCGDVRTLIQKRDHETCERELRSAMAKYPHAPQPHNLYGILLESMGDHPAAMKHFRAAWALDPTYRPARQNLELYGTFYSRGRCAYDESDCPIEDEPKPNDNAGYGARGVGRMIRRDHE